MLVYTFLCEFTTHGIWAIYQNEKDIDKRHQFFLS